MDDLHFRRTLYAAPNCADEEITKAAAQDPSKQAFWQELKQLDANLKRASKVPVPDDLAHRLILKQSLESHRLDKQRSRWYVALAASVAFVFGMSFTLFKQPSITDLGEYALAHVQNEGDGYALLANGDYSIETVNVQLASLGAQLEHSVGRIYYANFCNFNDIRSFHMVVEGENGKVSVFIVPRDAKLNPVDSFSDAKMAGQSIEASKASVILVSDKGKSFDLLKRKLKQNMIFSA